MAEDKFSFGFLVASISDIIDAIDVFLFCAIRCNSAKNSCSSEMLVWCPDKDTDIFFMFL